MSKDIDRILDEEGAAAEDGEADQTLHDLPAQVKISQPGRARSKVLQVRLNPEEYEALEAIAARREVSVSAVARGELLKLIDSDRAAKPAGTAFSQLFVLLGKAHEVREFAQDLEDFRNYLAHGKGARGSIFSSDASFSPDDFMKQFFDALPSSDLDEEQRADR